MTIIGWVETDDISDEEWADAPSDVVVLASYLTEAHEQCLAFLPQLPDADGVYWPVIPDPVPASFRRAQLLQARALQRSAVAGVGDQVGTEFPVTVFPMDWTVKNLLRPKRVGRVL